MDISSVDLKGKIEDVGPIHFLRAEWWPPAAQFVLLRYAVGGKEQASGIRLDLDKRAIMTDIQDRELSKAVREKSDLIWGAVINLVVNRMLSARGPSGVAINMGG